MSKNLLIPIDFEQATIDALRFALHIAGSTYDLNVLHLVSSDKEIAEAESKLSALMASLPIPDSITVNTKIINGKIESDINKVADTLESSFIIMGTHGSQGLGKVFGSKSIQVISESRVPYIVVQSGTEMRGCNKIAMTIDLEKESVQIVKAAIQLAKLFDCEIVLVGGEHTDPLLQQKVAVNVNTVRRVLSEQGIKSSLKLLKRKNFIDHFIDYCEENDVDIIAATYYPDTFSVFSKKFVQHLLENDAKIPVLTLDSVSMTVGSQYSFITV